MPKSNPKKKALPGKVPVLVNIPRALYLDALAKIKKDEEKLQVRRANSLTGVINSLLLSWTEGKVDPWA